MILLNIKNVNYTLNYKNIVSEFNMQLNSGEIIHLKGKNGSGKSCILQVLANIKSQNGSEILYNDGCNESDSGIDNACGGDKLTAKINLNNIFYLHDNEPLDNSTNGIDNLHFLVNLKVKQTKKQIMDKLDFLSTNLIMQQKVKYLSSGQRKFIVNLSLLFMTDFKIWLLDEPFNSLDSNYCDFFVKQIRKHANNGGACIFTSHLNHNGFASSEIFLKS